jgi:hypothetical protein
MAYAHIRLPASWSTLIGILLQARSLAEDEAPGTGLGCELVEMIGLLREPLATATTTKGVVELIRAMIDIVDQHTFRRLHPQYIQGDFFENHWRLRADAGGGARTESELERGAR